MKSHSLNGFDKLMDNLRGFFLVVMTMGLMFWLFLAFGFRINLTSSVPVGLYQVRPNHGVLKRGQIVWFCPPDIPKFQKSRDAGIIPTGDCPGNYLHWFKPVAALSGDIVKVCRDGVFVNGKFLQNSKPMVEIIDGRKLMPFYGIFRVKPGDVWLVSTFDSRSYDSRYLGPIRKEFLKWIATPLQPQSKD